jgi:cytoskeletal protein CcmA (bactofilin family)
MFERKNSKADVREEPPKAAAEPAAPATSSSPAPHTSTRGNRAMIGSKVKVNGDIISGEDLLVEGEVNGTITLAENELVVGTSGRVQANITAKTIRIEGEVKGDIDGSERVIICASGDVQGNVTAPRVILEDGGRFKGNIDMGGAKAAPSIAPKAASGATPEVHKIDKAG